jgi:transposase-like protein
MPTRADHQNEPMVPRQMFCPNPQCPLRGQLDRGNITSHSAQERRYMCNCCGRSFAETKGTPFYRRRYSSEWIIIAQTLRAHGCPPQAIVAAFGVDERTLAAWQQATGKHCEQIHAAEVASGRVDTGHVQADEMWVKTVGRKFWMALALAVPSRLWLAGAIAERRDGDLIQELVRRVRRCLAHPGILVCVDGLSSYVSEFRRAFQLRHRAGDPPSDGPQLPPGFLLGQVVKHASGHRVTEVVRRAVFGTLAEIETRIRATKTGQVLNTAYIERLNATFRGRMSPLVRRGRALARRPETLRAGMYLVGTVYNFCTFHGSLRQRNSAPGGHKWQPRTPAMAAGLTDHRWTMAELLWHRVAPAPWCPGRVRGRPPKEPPRFFWKRRPKRFVLLATTV